MKYKQYIGLLLGFFLFFLSCSESPITDPPVLSDKWTTAYDIQSEGISKSWFTEFPSSNFTGSTWDDWQMPNAKYRWHKQRFRVGDLDSTAFYNLSCSTIASPSLIWLNGQLIDQLDYSESYSIPITDLLIPNTYNELILRNEYNSESFGIHSLKIDKRLSPSNFVKQNSDYNSMPIYHALPNYAQDLIIYEAFPRYFSGNNFTGIQNMSSRLNQLGINMVRLLPIHPTCRAERYGNYGNPYAVRNYFTTDSDLGSMTQFSSLRSMLHRNKIKLMLDAPITFSAIDHSWVRDYPSYYKQDEQGNMLHPTDYPRKDVYAFDLNDDNLRKRIFSYFDFWLEQGVDAFKLTDSEHIPYDFIETLRDYLHDEDLDPLLIADGTKAEHFLYGLDAIDGNALYQAFVALSTGRADASIIGKTLSEEISSYPENALIVHYAENHETERAWDILGINDHQLALFTIFTAPGIPMILCGEELQAPPKLDLYSKTDINWYNIHWPSYNLISKLAKLRSESPILTRGSLHRIADTESIAGFSRRYKNETWHVLMNYGNKEITYTIDAKSTVFSDGTSKVVSEGKVKLKAKGYCIVK
jgi:glycosidase